MRSWIFALLTAMLPMQAMAAPLVVREGDVQLRNFRFATGQTLPALRIHYRTLGTPHRNARGEIDNAILILHSSGSQGSQFLRDEFAGVLFGPGQPLDIQRYFVILPDAIGHGSSSKPSEGLRTRFPRYDYYDMVDAQRGMLDKAFGIRKLRLVMGTSLGCSNTFLWATRFPGTAAAYLPLACLPKEVSGQNRVWRKAVLDSIRADPAYAGGGYSMPPELGMRAALSVQMIAAGIGPRAMAREYPTAAAADRYYKERLARDLKNVDANDLIYQLEASTNYDPSGQLHRIAAPLAWINFEDDAINLPHAAEINELAARIPGGRFVLIPATEETRGHGTHTWPRFWKNELVDLLGRSGGLSDNAR